ncbi:LuxR C-terminal-related transcriptional regulator [Streptomyces sp. NPDC056465]|uniref:helix-turn-helix transcriptional regulator n=1 Tax=unclassified Streptomyces TaxID=2593676 RepID=UPI0036CA0310
MDQKVDELEADLSPEALAVYDLALQGTLFAPDSDKAGVSELVRVGLLEPSPGGTALRPVDPRLAERRLASAWRTRAWQMELRAAQVERTFEPLISAFSAQHTRAPQPLEYIHGMEEIGACVDRISREAAEEILTAQPGGGRSADTLERALPLAQEQLRRSVRMQTLYQHSARFNEPTKRYVEAVSESGGEVRTLDEFFERIFVIDRSLALLPANKDRTSAVVVRDRALVSFLADVFDRNWQRATPFVPTGAAHAAAEVMPDIHNMIKRLLLEGFPDSAIARRLGISERTYHTHLARIRKEMGATTRLQLGYQLAKEELARSGQAESASPDDVSAG